MEIILSLFLLGLGIFILIKGADFMVEGASSIAVKLNISSIVIGLTVVAFGTSLPELIISLLSAFEGSTELALGNVIGSNIANILLILGVSSLIYPLSVKSNTVWKEIPFLVLATTVLTILVTRTQIDFDEFSNIDFFSKDLLSYLTLSDGLILLLLFLIFISYTFSIANNSDPEMDSEELTSMNPQKSSLLIILGVAGLALGSQLTVSNATSLASYVGVSEGLIALTIVALGTSLPELITSCVAALKKNTDIAIGNVVGSNIFNTLLVLGATLLASPIPINGQNLLDIIISFFVTVILFASIMFFKYYKIDKIEGGIFLILYFSYIIFIFYRG